MIASNLRPGGSEELCCRSLLFIKSISADTPASGAIAEERRTRYEVGGRAKKDDADEISDRQHKARSDKLTSGLSFSVQHENELTDIP